MTASRSPEPVRRTFAAARIQALVLAGMLVPEQSAAEAPFPHPVRVQVRNEGTVAAERSLRQLEAGIVRELRRSGCAPDAAVAPSEPADTTTIVLRVVIREVSEEARWNMSIGDRAEAQQRGGEQAVVSTTFIRVLGTYDVVVLPEQALVRSRKFNVATEWTPDARGGGHEAEVVREKAIDRVAVDARKALCKSRGKLLHEIERVSASP